MPVFDPVCQRDLDCATDSVTICPGANPIVVNGTVALDAPTLAALEVITVNQGTSPWIVSGPLTDTQLRATPVPVSGSVTVSDGSGPLTVDGTVAATQSGTWTVNIGTIPEVEIKNDSGNPVPVTGPLTDTQLRATAVPVSGTVAATQSGVWTVTQSGTWTMARSWDLNFAVDQVDASGSVVALDATTLAALESITVQNGAGASAVNIQDGGNSITVDGTVTVNQGTSPWVSDMTDRAARQVGLVDIRKASTVSTPAQTAITSVASTVLASNAARRSFIIQNTGTVPVKLSLDGTGPTQTAYHLCLSSCTVADDGTGAVYMDDQWTGDVKAISPSAGTIVVTEVT